VEISLRRCLAAKVAGSGAFTQPAATRLITVPEMLTALGGSGTTAHRALGQPG
jgi:hypothetical protein